MNLLNMYYEIQNTLYPISLNQLSYGDFIVSLNQALRTINAEAEKPNELVHIYPLEGKLIAELNEETIEEETYIIGGENERYPYLSWNDNENMLVIPDTWTKILAIYMNDRLMEQVPITILKQEKNPNQYSIFNRSIFFNITKDQLEIYMKIRRDYPFPQIEEMENYTGFPENGYQLLFSAVMTSLLSRPRFNDMNLLNFYRQQYYELLAQFSQLNMTRPQPTMHWRT